MSDKFTSWEDYDRAATGLLAQQYGWGRGVDPTDDRALLDWAHHYLPKVLELAQRSPGGAA